MEPETPDSSTPARPDRVLRRSADDRMIGGVAGGLARYLGVDSAVVRILFVVLLVFGGSGLIAYLIAWVAIPEEQADDPVGPENRSDGAVGPILLGGLLVAVGTILLLDQVLPGFRALLGPLLLIAVGLVIMVGVRR